MPASPLLPSLEDLERLARKYRQLAEIRRAKARGEADPEKGFFRALAAELPGSLNELDTLPLDVIDRRAELLERAADGSGDLEPWMAYTHAYHAFTRAALHVRLVQRRARAEESSISDAAAAAIAAEASERAGIAVNEAFVRAILHPPGGRMNKVIFSMLAEAFSAPADEVKRSIFPRSRHPA